MRLEVEVRVRRGAIGESRHRIEAVIVDPAARPLAGTDGADRITSFRSAAKPFQLLALVERGHADRLGFGDEHLAIMAASHTGSRYHLGLVRDILDRIGLEPHHLACGYHDPLDAESLADVQACPETRSALYNNCSGKHAGMLCLALAEGWPTSGYERAGHPLQSLMHDMVAECCGVTRESIATGIDGCSVVVFGLPLAAMARGYAVLAAARTEGGDRMRALVRIRGAMQAFPVATGGEGRFSTALMQAAPGVLIAKGGAEGLECVGLPQQQLGLALKCDDGAARAVAPAVIAVLDHLRLLPETARAALESWRRPVVTNYAGLETGTLDTEIRVLTTGAV